MPGREEVEGLIKDRERAPAGPEGHRFYPALVVVDLAGGETLSAVLITSLCDSRSWPAAARVEPSIRSIRWRASRRMSGRGIKREAARASFLLLSD
jgi:hypothetical protein